MTASAKEFREHYQLCLFWADRAQNDEHRRVLRELAKTWLKTAIEVERSWALERDIGAIVSPSPAAVRASVAERHVALPPSREEGRPMASDFLDCAEEWAFYAADETISARNREILIRMAGYASRGDVARDVQGKILEQMSRQLTRDAD